MSVADIGDHGLSIISVASSPDELIVGRFFSGYEVTQTVCVFGALSPYAFGAANLSTLYLFFCSILSVYVPINCCCLFLMVLRGDLLYLAISITYSFDFFSVHDILIILRIYHIAAASSLLSRSFVSVQQSHPCRRVYHS